MSNDTITSITGIAGTLVAAGGVGVAISGLSTWRKQLKGTAEYDLAKHLLLSVYKVREALHYVRQPFLSAGESSTDSEKPWQVSAYENRWKEVQDVMVELQAVALEAEVIWGKPVVESKNKLGRQVRKLNVAVNMYITSQLDKSFASDFTKEHRDTLYEISDEDSFNQETNSIIEEFENFAKPHIGRK